MPAHQPGVDAGAVAEQRPDDGDDAFLGREVEWRSALAILLHRNVGVSQTILIAERALQTYFHNTSKCFHTDGEGLEQFELRKLSDP